MKLTKEQIETLEQFISDYEMLRGDAAAKKWGMSRAMFSVIVSGLRKIGIVSHRKYHPGISDDELAEFRAWKAQQAAHRVAAE